MAGPHPVVGVASELADRGRRSTYETDITINLVDKEEILVAIVKSLDRSAESLASFDCILDKTGGISPYD